MSDLGIDARIERASTLPGSTYHDPRVYARLRQRVLATSWQLVAAPPPSEPAEARPFTLLPGCLDEPLAFVVNESGSLRCLSNVCTHRGAEVVCAAGPTQGGLRCRYHGRCFGLDGRLRAAPGFEDAEAFPSASDDLQQVALERWGPLSFVSLDPAAPFSEFLEPLRERLGWLPLEEFSFDPDSSRDYSLDASWLLYVENYLEGLHIPYVHEGLKAALDWPAYRTELFTSASLQIGGAKATEHCFELPPGHPDTGQRVAAYYFWLYPNTMLNFYPWGLSANIVEPQGCGKTRVRFLAYVWDATKRHSGAGAALHAVELEDESIVESANRGVQSRLYDRGRYAPRHERAVHHFHGLLVKALTGDRGSDPGSP